ncbi:MAG: hypothetical protein ABIH85_07475 [Candidatus Omnitrophota bacterium]|nr:hypothetical protein [Candidatus Omnitrophota bacterium]MBU1894703.1 hypothetical protein [Candidatus Omnitrophota bacterium]
MKITEIQKLEKDNTKFINLTRGGLFCRAYETSAMLFAQNLKQFNVQKKYYKGINATLVFIGFPGSVLESIINVAKSKGYAVAENTDDLTIRIKTKGIAEASFKEWKNSICYSAGKTADTELSRVNLRNNEVNIIPKLRSYSVAEHTPIETMQFVMQLQKDLAEMKNAGVTGITDFG